MRTNHLPNTQLLRLHSGELPAAQADQLAVIGGETIHASVTNSRTLRLQRSEEARRSVPTMIVEKSALFRAGLTHILAGTRFRVVAECSCLGELPIRTLNSKQAVLLLGLDKDLETGLAQVGELTERHPGLRVVTLSERFNPVEALSVVKSRADGYLLKDEICPDVLLKSLELLLVGAVVVSRGWVDGLTNGDAVRATDAGAPPEPDSAAQASGQEAPAAILSARERLILSHLMHGASNKHIARDLGIAEATVKVHVKSLLRKIRLKNRTQAAVWGHRQCV